ncbi:MAG: DUF3597 domain-containing protein [Nitrospira sp.]|jgi:pyruvate/2-oxoglutarate dehydrogenase complex dihydrolipoamide acyltransferase (E2) component|nr:DUF3597 domain-containing protein [Nitrospira sp.]
MGLFSTIMDKLGFGEKPAQAATPPAPPSASATTTAPTAPSAAAQPRPTAMSAVDVVGKLDSLAAKNSQKLNWKTSIVDLMKLLGLDSSLNARKELATELGCPADKMGDSAQMNMWLHKAVLQKLAANGGNIPKELFN